MDATKETAAEVKDAAEKTVNEIKPQVNEAVQQVKEAGRFLSLTKDKFIERHLVQKIDCPVWNSIDLCIRNNSFQNNRKKQFVCHSRDTTCFWSNDSQRLIFYSLSTSKERQKDLLFLHACSEDNLGEFSLGAELADDAAKKVEQAKEAGAELAADAKDAAEKKVEEIKPQVEEKLEQAKETAAEVADAAATKVEEAKSTIVESAIHAKDAVVEKAVETKDAIVESAIHAKDAVVEKAQEIGHAVRQAWRWISVMIWVFL